MMTRLLTIKLRCDFCMELEIALVLSFSSSSIHKVELWHIFDKAVRCCCCCFYMDRHTVFLSFFFSSRKKAYINCRQPLELYRSVKGGPKTRASEEANFQPFIPKVQFEFLGGRKKLEREEFSLAVRRF